MTFVLKEQFNYVGIYQEFLSEVGFRDNIHSYSTTVVHNEENLSHLYYISMGMITNCVGSIDR